jgi:hypothetical protein
MGVKKRYAAGSRIAPSVVAEQVGFEPTVRHNRTPDFESGAFDHSATSPRFDSRGAKAAILTDHGFRASTPPM